MEDSPVVNVEGWRLCLLSNFRLEHDGELVVKFTKRRQDVLLAYLALHPDQAHARPAVAELLWPGKPLKLALNRLTEILTVFNKQLRALELPVTLVDAGYHTIQLGSDIRTDVQDLEEAMAQAMVESDPAKQEALLAQVVNLHGAGLLPVLNEPWVAKERVRLRATRDGSGSPLGPALGR